jgi:hypothetical protein
MEAERNNPGILKSAIPNAHHYVPVVEAPPPSSVPGEAGTYKLVPLDGYPDLSGLSGPGFIGNTNVRALDVDKVANTAYAQGRASMKAEMEAAMEGLRNAKVAMTCAGNSREPYDIGRYLRDGLVAVDAALTPSKENQS